MHRIHSFIHSFKEHFTCCSYRLRTFISLKPESNCSTVTHSFPSGAVNLKLQVAVIHPFFFPPWQFEKMKMLLSAPLPTVLFVYPFILLPFLFPSTKAFFGLLSTHLRPNEISWVLIKDGVWALSERIQERRMSRCFFTSRSSCRLSFLHFSVLNLL